MISWLADAVVFVHLAFVAFVVLGGFLVLRWPRVAWAHVPAAAWGTLVEFAGWICPLTPLENALRARAGEAGYGGDFVDHYVMPLLYPDWLTRPTQLALGAAVLIINSAVYVFVVVRWRRRRRVVDVGGRSRR